MLAGYHRSDSYVVQVSCFELSEVPSRIVDRNNATYLAKRFRVEDVLDLKGRSMGVEEIEARDSDVSPYIDSVVVWKKGEEVSLDSRCIAIHSVTQEEFDTFEKRFSWTIIREQMKRHDIRKKQVRTELELFNKMLSKQDTAEKRQLGIYIENLDLTPRRLTLFRSFERAVAADPKRTGVVKTFFMSGSVRTEEQFREGVLTERMIYDETCLKSVQVFHNGELKSEELYRDGEIFEIVDHNKKETRVETFKNGRLAKQYSMNSAIDRLSYSISRMSCAQD